MVATGAAENEVQMAVAIGLIIFAAVIGSHVFFFGGVADAKADPFAFSRLTIL
jgi:hypothetical protein